ncbi:ABC transporter permease [Brevundimonas nasdae]|uniref:ABC transporter permease n=2 Tax=Bacteria TaxID=2 RepID=A0ABX8TKW3_9CAUL|nr:ABC transporter permease [Brevundimonas nasdae]QYC11858.1 ABC transporter permease [Brevundimonas nasdae]QYC14644.1 ABC transporter permease [Brevundimonas nasdae]
MKSLALKSLIHDWRRFSPAVVAVAFSGLLVLLQAALILGIFSLSSLYVTKSSADVWIGYPGVQSVDLGRPISEQAELSAWMQPGVKQVEPLLWGSGQWRTETQGAVNVYIVGVALDAQALALAGTLGAEERSRLAEPDTVLIDAADMNKLDVAPGDTAEINGRRVRIVGLTNGLRGLGGVNVIASVATTRALDPAAAPKGRVGYVLARFDTPENVAAATKALNMVGKRAGFEAMQADAFADRSTLYWLAESGAGIAFIFGSIVAVAVAVIITSQTLTAAVVGSIREYAALRALGFSMGSLRAIVLEQSAWVGVAGLAAAGVMTLLLAAVARTQGVPIVLSLPMMAGAGILIILVALGSGAWALRRVGKADPASLLL